VGIHHAGSNTAEGGSDMSDIDASSFIPSTSLPPELMPEIDPAVAESPVIRFPACGPLESRHLGSACDVGRDLPGQREIVKEGGGIPRMRAGSHLCGDPSQ